MNKPTFIKCNAYTIFVMVLLLLSFIYFWEKSEAKQARKDLSDQAKVLENALWNMDSKAPQKYLELAIINSNYTYLQVLDDHDEAFLEITGKDPSLMDSFLEKVSLIGKKNLTMEITTAGTKIGTLKVTRLFKGIYIYIYIIIILFLLLVAINLFLWVIKEKQLLEVRVIDRTSELTKINEELHRREDDLKKSEVKYRMLVENIPQRIFYKNTNSEYISCNINLANDLGITPDEITGKTDFDFFPRELAEKYRHDDQRIFKQKVLEEIEEEYRLSDKIRIVNTLKTPVKDDDGNIIGILGIFSDVTEKVETEKQLRQSQKMEAVGKLAGGIAHDFNNMLAGIMGYAEILSGEIPGQDHLIKFTTKILEITQRASELTQRLLEFSRQVKGEIKPVDIHKAINAACSILEHCIDKRIRIEKTLVAERYIIDGDETLIQNMIINLGLNARDAMPDGGVISIKTTNISNDELKKANTKDDLINDEYIEIVLIDSGTGMTSETQEHIFDPFFTTKDIGKGTGLGLSAVYGTVKDHSGAINVHSELNKGTTFKIFLPITDKEPQIVQNEVTSSKGVGTILLVDDEEIIRDTIQQLLEGVGYKMLLAEDGIDGVNVYKEHQKEIDIVLLDVAMPKQSGEDTYYQLKRINPNIKVIMTSGYDFDTNMENLFKNGVLGFIKKPYKHGELISRINQFMEEFKKRKS